MSLTDTWRRSTDNPLTSVRAWVRAWVRVWEAAVHRASATRKRSTVSTDLVMLHVVCVRTELSEFHLQTCTVDIPEGEALFNGKLPVQFDQRNNSQPNLDKTQRVQRYE